MNPMEIEHRTRDAVVDEARKAMWAAVNGELARRVNEMDDEALRAAQVDVEGALVDALDPP